MKIYVGQRTLVAKSCHDCGQLKLARDFPKVRKGKYYNTVCMRCHKKIVDRSSKRINARSLDTATSHRKPITDSEIAEVLKLSEEGYTAQEIGRRLGRTYRAVIGIRYYNRDRE